MRDAGAGEWTSPFATVSINEDLIETYRQLIGLLTPNRAGTATLTSLQITIPTATMPLRRT